MHVLLKFLLAHASAFMHPYPKGTFGNKNVNVGLRYFSLHDVPIFFATVVPSIQNLNAIDFDNEHGRPHDMPGHVRRNLDAVLLSLNSKLDGINTLQAVQNLLVIEECLVSLHLGGIAHEIVVYIFGGFCHIDLTFVVVPSEEVGKRTAVVQMCVGYYHHRDLLWVYAVEERKAVGILLVYHETAVEHYFFGVDGQNEAGSAYFAARA